MNIRYRCAYPLEHIPGAVIPAVGDHPNNIIFLTCDGMFPNEIEIRFLVFDYTWFNAKLIQSVNLCPCVWVWWYGYSVWSASTSESIDSRTS